MKRTGDAVRIFNRNVNDNVGEELSSSSCLFQLKRHRWQNSDDPCPSSCFSHHPLASSCSSYVSSGNSKEKLKIKDLQGVAGSLILPNYSCARLYLVVAMVSLWVAVGMCDGRVRGGVITLSLERAFSRSQDGMKLSELTKLDRVRHGRLLQQSFGNSNGVVDFEVNRDSNSIGYAYYTKVRLGSPPKEFYVQIDTGSDLLWVSCSSCSSCPRSTLLQIQLQVFDPSRSSTVSAIACADKSCALAVQFSASGCSPLNQCTYDVHYADDSGTSGAYLTDMMHFEIVHGSATFSNSSAQVMFGCSTSRVGGLSSSATSLDGIFGLGQSGLSVISQISYQGVASNVFSHCLKGSGGGILVLGEILDPNIVYTPLLPSKPHYNVDLWSISVNGQPLQIRQSVFSTSNNGGTIIDSGTTLAYLPQEAYQPLIEKVTEMVSPYARFISHGDACYEVASNISETFPTIELNFAGGASMVLKPGDYMLSIGFGAESNSLWCIGFRTSEEQGLTILGDLVLQDKIVIYDVAKQRIGWGEYDCPQHVTVLEPPKTERGHLKGSNASSQHDLYHWMASVILVYLLLI